jgi:parallel beta-helix repeat protein
MKNRLIGKGLVFGIIVIFIGANIIPSTIGIIEKKITFSNTASPGYIQDLIDNAPEGDTINIPSGIYYENIIINKSISLIGEDKETTFIDGTNDGHAVDVFADWVNISGFTIQNSSIGISINANRSSVSNTLILNHFFGISLWLNSSNNIIIDNNITSNDDCDIYLSYSSNNTIRGNTIISDNGYGIRFDCSSNNSVTDNSITTNNTYGISIEYYSQNNTITDNTITSNNYYGIFLNWYSDHNNISGNNFFNNGLWIDQSFNNNVKNNKVNGKPLVYLKDISNRVITEDAGQVLLVNCKNITVENLDLSNTCVGIALFETNNSIIRNNVCSKNLVGIYLWGSSKNTITDNNISNNSWNGILLDSWWYYSDNNTIMDNIISHNRWGIELSDSSRNDITCNTIINNTYYGIFFHNSDNNHIKDNNIAFNIEAGVFLWSSSSNVLKENNIISNHFGIDLYHSCNRNKILKNNFIGNKWSVYFKNSYKNIWLLNYWNRPRILPKLILGRIEIVYPEWITWLNIDIRPALSPYEVN